MEIKRIDLMVLSFKFRKDAIEQFQKDFLIIYNNVRENKDTFLKMELTSSSLLIFKIPNNEETINKVKDWYILKYDFDLVGQEVETTKVIADYDDLFNDNVMLDSNVDIVDIDYAKNNI